MDKLEVVDTIRDMISSVIKNKTIQNDTQLSDLNIDSMTVVLLASEIEEKYDIGIDPAVIYELNSINEISDFILQESQVVAE